MSKPLHEKVVSEMMKTVDSIGIKKTIQGLQISRQVSEDHSPLVEFIIKTVCTRLCVSYDDIMSEHSQNDDTLYARAFIIFYLRKKGLQWVQLKIILKRKDQSWLFRTMQHIKELNPLHRHDQPYCEHKKHLDVVIKKYKP